MLGTQSLRRSRGIKPCYFYNFSRLAFQDIYIKNRFGTDLSAKLTLFEFSKYDSNVSCIIIITVRIGIKIANKTSDAKVANLPCRIPYILKTRRHCSSVANSVPESLPQLLNPDILSLRSPVFAYISSTSARKVGLVVLHSLSASRPPSSLLPVLFLFCHVVVDLASKNPHNLVAMQFLMAFFSPGCR